LPLADIKGKDYLLVPHRVMWFREEYPFGRIQTDLIESSDKHAMYKATISIPWDRECRYLATATKREDASHFPDFHEKAETGAIGRALAFCGYGTQFAHDLEEKERLSDAPLQPAPRPPVTIPPTDRPNLPILALAERTFSIGKNTGKTFGEFAFPKESSADKSAAMSYWNWIKSQINTLGLDKVHADFRMFDEYMKMVTKNTEG